MFTAGLTAAVLGGLGLSAAVFAAGLIAFTVCGTRMSADG
jgi:hypothetical protein